MLSGVALGTAGVLTPKLAVVSPAGMLTVEGSDTTPEGSLVSVTVAPPAGAGPFSVTVPWTPWPPITLAALSVTDGMIAWVVALAPFEKAEAPPAPPGRTW